MRMLGNSHLCNDPAETLEREARITVRHRGRALCEADDELLATTPIAASSRPPLPASYGPSRQQLSDLQ